MTCSLQIQGCDRINGASSFMESPQCLGYSKYRKGMPDLKVSRDLCAPPTDTILKTVEEIVVKIDAQYLFIATDNNPMLNDFQKHLQPLNVSNLLLLEIQYSSMNTIS